MIKKLISLALASVSTLALAGCGATDNPSMDTSIMGDGSSNKTGLGGFWWTYVDRSGRQPPNNSSVFPDTGKENPLDTTTTPAKLKASIGAGNGIEAGAYHVTGTVGTEPYYQATDVYDTYWDDFYGPNGNYAPNVCGPNGCLEMKYPAVGLGFGFKAKNVPLGQDAVGKLGIAFKMKIGGTHPAIATAPINVSLPMDLTDVPDPTFGDLFGTLHAGIAATGNADDAKNTPICTFPGTITGTDATGALTFQTSASKTCFCNMTTDTHTVLAPTTEWTTYCLAWKAFGVPDWGGLGAASPIAITEFNDELTKHIIKMQFDAFKPPYDASGAAPAVPFDFYVDDVILLDQAKWTEICNAANGVKIFPAAT